LGGRTAAGLGDYSLKMIFKKKLRGGSIPNSNWEREKQKETKFFLQGNRRSVSDQLRKGNEGREWPRLVIWKREGVPAREGIRGRGGAVFRNQNWGSQAPNPIRVNAKEREREGASSGVSSTLSLVTGEENKKEVKLYLKKYQRGLEFTKITK